ncbi:hypothetical protein LINGRAHAP2_LOCUS32412 [Linum grandiflorum]
MSHPPGSIDLCIVGTFLTTREVNFPTMCQVLSKARRPGRGVEINELEGRLFLFRCNHIIDVRRIIDDGPWSFDGHLLLTHELQQGETPSQVALNTVAFWIQVHNLPHRYFSE